MNRQNQTIRSLGRRRGAGGGEGEGRESRNHFNQTASRPCVNFKGRTVLITGASSGIGREAAAQFAGRGANLVLVARRGALLEEIASGLAAKSGIRALPCRCDISKREEAEQAVHAALEELGGVDVLVNNAGFAISGAVSELSIDEMESQMRTNYFGMLYCTRLLLPHMLERGSGHVVNVASVAASFGLPGIAPYCASKFAMLGFSEGLRHELRGTGVGVTVVSPIMVRTEFFDHPSFENVPRRPPASLDPATVAKAILRAAGSPRLEIVVPPVVRAAIWLKSTFPYAVDPILGRTFRRYMQ